MRKKQEKNVEKNGSIDKKNIHGEKIAVLVSWPEHSDYKKTKKPYK